MDVPAAIKQHDKQGCHNPRYPDTALPDRLKLSEYAPYLIERYCILHAHACFTTVVQRFLNSPRLSVIYICCMSYVFGTNLDITALAKTYNI